MSGPEESGAAQLILADEVTEQSADASSCCHPSSTVSTSTSPEPIVSSRGSSGDGLRMSPRTRSASPRWVSDDDSATDIRRGTRVRPGSQCSSEPEERPCDSPRSGSSPRQQHQCFLASGSQAALCVGTEVSQLSGSEWLGEQDHQNSWLLDGLSNAPTPVDTGSPPITARGLLKTAACSSAAADQGPVRPPSEPDQGDDVWSIWQGRSADPGIATPYAGAWARHSAHEDADGWLSAGPVHASSSFTLALAEEKATTLEGEDISEQTMDWLVSDALGDGPVTAPDELTELLSLMGVTSHTEGDAASQAANADLLVQELLRICPELDLEVAACAGPASAGDEPVAATEGSVESMEPVAVEPHTADEEAAPAEPAPEDLDAMELAAVDHATEVPVEASSLVDPTASEAEPGQPSTAHSAETEASWEERFLQALTADFGSDFTAKLVSQPGSKEFDGIGNKSSLEERIVAALDLLGLREKADTQEDMSEACGSQVNVCPGQTGGSPLEPAFNPSPESGDGYKPIKLDRHVSSLGAFEPREGCQKHARPHSRKSRQASRKSKELDAKTADVLGQLQSRKKKKVSASRILLGEEAEDAEKLYAMRSGRLVRHNSISPPPMYQPFRRSAMEEDLSLEPSLYDAEAKDIYHKSQRISLSGSTPGWKQQVDPVSGQRTLSAKLTSSPSPRERQWSASASPEQRLYTATPGKRLYRFGVAVKPPGLLPDIKVPSANLVQSGLATVLGQSVSAPALPTCGKVMPGGLASYSSKASHAFYEKKYRYGGCGGHEYLHFFQEGRLPQMMCR